MPFQEFCDDGYSGSSMERPAIKQVLELARENKVQCIVVKDFHVLPETILRWEHLSGTDFSIPGYDSFSISDRYDSKDYKERGSDIEVQFKRLIADFYHERPVRKGKVKVAVSTRRGKGEYCCGSAPYGYRINPENKKKNW